jgi:hypothetical protein
MIVGMRREGVDDSRMVERTFKAGPGVQDLLAGKTMGRSDS